MSFRFLLPSTQIVTRNDEILTGQYRSDISNFKSLAEGISRQLRAWADSLQGSKIKGQRYLTEKTRQAEKAARERKGFLEKLRQIREQHKPGSVSNAKDVKE